MNTMKQGSKQQEILKIDINQFAQESWTQQERQNVELVVDFIQKLMNDHDFEYVRSKFGSHDYTQHNRAMTDGIEGVISYVSALVKRFPEYTYDVKHIYADGDFVIFHSHSTIKQSHRGNPDKGFNIFDTWKIDKGEIREHWDALQAVDGFMRMLSLLTGGKKLNNNTLY